MEKIRVLCGKKRDLKEELRLGRTELAVLKAEKRMQPARGRLMAAVCRYFGEDALRRAGVSSAPARRALREQEKRLVSLFGDPLPGSDCVIDALALLQEGYRRLHKTWKDQLAQNWEEIWTKAQRSSKPAGGKQAQA